MGNRLLEYFALAESKGGMAAKMRLAIKTGVPSTEAAQTAETPELIDKFKRALTDILGAGVRIP